MDNTDTDPPRHSRSPVVGCIVRDTRLVFVIGTMITSSACSSRHAMPSQAAVEEGWIHNESHAETANTVTTVNDYGCGTCVIGKCRPTSGKSAVSTQAR
jgi:hypothetical protein